MPINGAVSGTTQPPNCTDSGAATDGRAARRPLPVHVTRHAEFSPPKGSSSLCAERGSRRLLAGALLTELEIPGSRGDTRLALVYFRCLVVDGGVLAGVT